MGFKGSVESFSLADVFQNLAMNQQTGTLRVFGNGAEEKNVFFQNGQVRHLSRGSKSSLLPADVFVARGLVARGQIDAAVERQRETGQTLGNCLIDLGQINEEQLDEVTRHQIEEEIYDLFGWDHASFEFSDGAPSNLTSTGQFPQTGSALPISHLIMEAARRVDEWDRLRKLVPSPKEIYAMDLAVRKAVEKGEMEMDPVEKRVATLINGARDVDDLIEDSGLFKFEVWSALGSFVQSSLIRPAKIDELRFAEEDCARQNLPKRRMKILERILAAGGENTKVRKELAEVLAKEGDIERACIHFSVLADAELKAEREDAALELYKKILAISPKHVKSHEQLAAIHSKRGKKREAFVHYQELFETFREQNHMKEARVAGACALECDPTHSDLRNSLIELLLSDNQKEAAGQQLELMGDQAAKAGNVKLASDSYRRAMQCRPGNKQLKKKLADAMLTKEDRRARKQRTVLFLIVIVLLGTTGGGLALLEGSNTAKFNGADATAKDFIKKAEGLEQNKKFAEAKQNYLDAADKYLSVGQLLSPILHLGDKARDKAAELKRSATTADEDSEKQRRLGEQQAKTDLDAAVVALTSGAYFEARDGFDRVLHNLFGTEEVLATARKKMEETQAQIKEFDDGKARMARPPAEAFHNVEEETIFKKAFYAKFSRFLVPDQVKLPVLIVPNTDKIEVYLNGQIQGTVNIGAAKEQNTFRYSLGASHRFKFTKPGFESFELVTGDLRSPTFTLELERKPFAKIDLTERDPNIQISGDAVLNGDVIYVGTTNGSLIQIGDQQNPIVRRFDLPAAQGLNRDVYGQIYIYKREGKPDLIAYATRDGECVGVEVDNAPNFKLAWAPVKTNIMLAAPPSAMKIPLLTNHPIMMLPFGKEVYMVDCENGSRPFGGKLATVLPAGITSTITGIENNGVLVMGCSDGNMYGIELSKQQGLRTWSTDVRGAMVRGRPTVYEDKILAGAGDGKLYVFDAAKPGSKRIAIDLSDPDGGAGSIDADLLIVKTRGYVGSAIKDGFYCVDLNNARMLWRVPYKDMGPVTRGAAVMDNLVFFGTDTGKLFCIDADRGQIRWVYQLKNGKFACAPIVIGNRVYCFNTEGQILVFEEQPQN